MEKDENLGKREEEKRPEGHLLIKRKEYSQELYLVFKVSLGVNFLFFYFFWLSYIQKLAKVGLQL